ncbi:MAG: NADH-quinone oxidoreductase subunit N [Angustibacter sp.]
MSAAWTEAGSAVDGVVAVDWLAIGPVLAPAVGAVLVLLLHVLLGARFGQLAASIVGGGAVLVGVLLVLPLRTGTRSTVCVPAGDRVDCGFVVSPLTAGLQVIVLVAAGACLLLGAAQSSPSGHRAQFDSSGQDCLDEGRAVGPVPLVLLLVATAGACALAGARDLATLLVSVETASLPIVGLVAMRRDASGAEAGLKLLFTAITSFAVTALGAALVYAATGSLFLSAPARLVPGDSTGAPDLAAVHGVGLALLVAGVAYKLSLVPFHLWTPDTYAGAPLPVAAFLSTVSKAAGAAAVLVVLAVAAPRWSGSWSSWAAGAAVVTMTVGNLVALRQTIAVRLLAWSTVAQAGWVVLPLGGATGAPATLDAVQASVAYLAALVAGALAVFAVATQQSRWHPDGDRHPVSSYAGWWSRRPVASLVLVFGLLCLAGLPPGVMGTVAKLVALAPVVAAQSWWVVVAAGINVVVGLAVYLRWVVAVCSRPGTRRGETTEDSGSRWPLSARLAVGLAGAACVTLSVYPQGFVGLLEAGSVLR